MHATRVAAALGVLLLSLTLADVLPLAAEPAASIGLALAGSAIAASFGGLTPASLALGAIAALAYFVLRPAVPVLAAALLALLTHAARAVRARDAASAVTHLALAALAGASASYVASRWGGGDPLVRGVAIAVAALLLSAPFAMHVEDPRVVALARLAREARGPVRSRLLRAAALRRRAIEGPLSLARTDRRRMERAFCTVARLAEARLDAGAIDAGAIDRALSAHLDAIARWTRAMRSRWVGAEAIAADPGELVALGERVAAEAAALDDLARG